MGEAMSRTSARRSPLALAATSTGAIVALTILRVADAPPILQGLAQVVFLASFISLAIVDFTASVAIAMIELATFGAGGHWTLFGDGPSGRIVLDAIVTLRALAILGLEWRWTGRLDLGRYGLHALVLAIVIPGVWMSIGLLNGNRASDVFADGNGLAFFGFTIVFIVLLRRRQGPWIRHWLLIACAVNAVVTGVLIVATASGLIPMGPELHRVLLDQLSFGGNFGYQTNGAYRLYLGSGVYLQVGLALATWRLLSGRPQFWSWALYALLWADVLATYTRGFWIGAALAVGLILVLGSANIRRPAAIVAMSVVLFALSSAAISVVGFSLPDYVLNRTASSLSLGPGQPPLPTIGPGSSQQPGASGKPGTTPEPTPNPGLDIAGEVSNQVRVEQGRVLIGHIQQRPILGFGFGSIARDYTYGQIFSYELAYLDLLFKAGVVGLLLFLSYPLRLLVDALRGRIGRLALGQGVTAREASVVAAIVAPLLVTGGTDPYLLAAFGLFPILATIAWLDPFGGDVPMTASS
jgi:hypothetical protein